MKNIEEMSEDMVRFLRKLGEDIINGALDEHGILPLREHDD